jgi:hypothetical protein
VAGSGSCKCFEGYSGVDCIDQQPKPDAKSSEDTGTLVGVAIGCFIAGAVLTSIGFLIYMRKNVRYQPL